MTLYDKIIKIYPALEGKDFFTVGIILENLSDGNGDYIKSWNHASLSRPTQTELDNAS
jgi:hypothetical protein